MNLETPQKPAVKACWCASSRPDPPEQRSAWSSHVSLVTGIPYDFRKDTVVVYAKSVEGTERVCLPKAFVSPSYRSTDFALTSVNVDPPKREEGLGGFGPANWPFVDPEATVGTVLEISRLNSIVVRFSCSRGVVHVGRVTRMKKDGKRFRFMAMDLVRFKEDETKSGVKQIDDVRGRVELLVN